MKIIVKRKKIHPGPLVFVVSGKSGAGKSTLIKALCKMFDKFKKVVPYTTGDPRPGEVEGSDYHFVSEGHFISVIFGLYFPYIHLKSNFSRENNPHIKGYCWIKSISWFLILFLGVPAMIHGLLPGASEMSITIWCIAFIMIVVVLFILFVTYLAYEFPWSKLIDFFKW